MTYNYLIPRLRARKSRIFRKTDYEALLLCKNTTEVRDYLRSSPFGPYIEAASARTENPEYQVLFALRRTMNSTFQFIWNTKPHKEEMLIKFIFLPWEILNLKTILRGIHQNLHRDVLLENLFPAGEFTQRRLNDLAKQPDFKSLIRYLFSAGSVYAPVLEKSFIHFEETGHFRDLEINLDRFAFDYYIKNLSKFGHGKCARDILRIRIDMYNILTLFKNISETRIDSQHTPIKLRMREEQFIEGGGRLTKEKFLEYLKISSLDKLAKKMSDTIRDRRLSDYLLDADPEDFVLTEERFEDYMEKLIFRRSLRDPRPYHFLFAFLYMKVREIKNIRFILASIKFKIDPEETRTHLFYPLIDMETEVA